MKESNSGGIGLGSLLAVLFIGLKLGKVINWSWVWVLSPLWIPIGFAVLCLIVIGIAAISDK